MKRKFDISSKELFSIHCIITHTEDTNENFIKFMSQISDNQVKLCDSLVKYKNKVLKEE